MSQDRLMSENQKPSQNKQDDIVHISYDVYYLKPLVEIPTSELTSRDPLSEELRKQDFLNPDDSLNPVEKLIGKPDPIFTKKYLDSHAAMLIGNTYGARGCTDSPLQLDFSERPGCNYSVTDHVVDSKNSGLISLTLDMGVARSFGLSGAIAKDTPFYTYIMETQKAVVKFDNMAFEEELERSSQKSKTKVVSIRQYKHDLAQADLSKKKTKSCDMQQRFNTPESKFKGDTIFVLKSLSPTTKQELVNAQLTPIEKSKGVIAEKGGELLISFKKPISQTGIKAPLSFMRKIPFAKAGIAAAGVLTLAFKK